MIRNRKTASASAIESMTDREKAILLVLSEADEALDHKQICMRIAEPWYEKGSSFRASVSSTLGVMRSKGLIKAKLLSTGDPEVMTRDRRWVQPKIRVWTTNGYAMARGHSGGLVKSDPAAFVRLIGDTGPAPTVLRHYQQQVVDQISEAFGVATAVVERRTHFGKSREITIKISADTGASLNPKHLDFKAPITDDMCAMVDDINRVEETPARRYDRSMVGVIKRVQRRMANEFDQMAMRAIRGL